MNDLTIVIISDVLLFRLDTLYMKPEWNELRH